ncbi:MAG TPA: PQQ-dependent sugar dehydrogenase [Anaerolineales bacterium]|nr:PQQ-dependent sugar dehydrogenase [Anaerolineales bacterium]
MRTSIFYRFLASVIPFVLFIQVIGETPASAAAPFDPANVVFREAVSGLVQPVFIANAGDGSNRLFVVERAGRVRIFKDGSLLPVPFLDIQSIVNDTGSEQGLLALAFHPSYENNGQFYTVYTDQNGSLVLSRFSRSAGNPDLANPNSRVPLLTIPHPTHQNHNGGTLAFGRDGYLYWSTGDGGGGGDPFNNAQNLNSLLGKILRLDVDRADPGLNYFIPRSNPFYNMPNRRWEIWAYGLRNPWRVSFDRGTGDLFIGDVGQSSREEIDFQPSGSAGGENYGWRIMEGTLCFNPSTGCNQSGKVLPVAEYSHSVGCSVTGGYIYRGAFYPDMQGQYFYGDFCSGIIFSLFDDPVNGWTVTQVVDTPYLISTFGEDEQGELYFTDYGAGKMYQICYGPTADFTVRIAGTARGSFSACQRQVLQKSFPGLNNGPVEIRNIDNLPSIAAQQVIYRVSGVNTSFSEMMALPNSQLDNVYYLPWYNNVNLDTQLRIANVSGASATIHVSIAGVEMTGSPFTLAAGASTRKSFPGLNTGPVKIESDQNIVAAARVIYRVNSVNTSFSEMMALPDSQLNTAFWLPWYNNVDLDTQLRFANVSNLPATVHVSIGGAELQGSPFALGAGESIRRSFAGINAGPLQIESDQNILAAERVIYKVNGINTSFSEMMALPDSQLNTIYYLPWYNNVGLDTQLRVANVSSSLATVHVYIGGAEMTGSPFTLAAGASTRRSFAGVNNGPVQIVSDQNIVAAARVIYKVNNIPTSFSEMMGLPAGQLDTTFWLPWYNNVDLDTRLRFAAP